MGMGADVYDLRLTFAGRTEFIGTNSKHLSSQSKVFREIISKAENSTPKKLTITDFDPDTVYEALRCLHTIGRSLTNVSQALLLRTFGKKYKMRLLCALCEKFIYVTLTDQNLEEAHDLACYYNDRTIQYHCWLRFDLSWRLLFSNPSFYTCNSKTMMRYVLRPVYEDLDEYLLWSAVYYWTLQNVLKHEYVNQEESHRKAMEEYLPHIRFLIMNDDELNAVFNGNILTQEECDALQRARCTRDVMHLPPSLCRENFPRRRAYAYEYISHIISFYCPKHTIMRWVEAGDVFYAEFTVKRDCFLKGWTFPLYGFEKPLCGILEIMKVFDSRIEHMRDGARKFQFSTRFVTLNPPLFIEENCTVYINILITEARLNCMFEPGARCNIAHFEKSDCEKSEKWKSFYLNELNLYF